MTTAVDFNFDYALQSAHRHLEQGLDHLRLFADDVQAIHDSGAWKAKGFTRWDAFFSHEFGQALGHGYSRFRQIMRALPVMEMVEAETTLRLSESALRPLVNLPPEKIVLAVQRAQELAGGNTPTITHIKAVLNTAKVLADTGSVAIGGTSIKPDEPLDPIAIAEINDVLEANQRQAQYIADKSKHERVEGIGKGFVVIGDKSYSIAGKSVILIIKGD